MLNDLRGQGRRRVFTEIRQARRIARVDLARSTGISQATVTAITADLIREGLIEEVERRADPGEIRRGRPRVGLRVRGAAHVVAGVKLARRTASVVFLDFEGTQVGEDQFALDPAGYETHDLVPLLAEALARSAERAGLDFAAISGVGIGLAGFIDAAGGIAYWSPTLRERNVPLRRLLADALGRPVYLDNDANLVAMAERTFGLGRAVQDFLVVTIESGVGSGIVLGGELYRGARGCGAEFGHTKVHLDGALCRCGQRGCLEAYVGDYAILREAAMLRDWDDSGSDSDKIVRLIAAARGGDRTAQTIVERSSRMFALGLANLVNIFDPQLIILSGERMQLDFLYAEEVLESIRQQVVQVDVAPPEIVIHKWGDQMWAMGAAAYAVDGVADLALAKLAEQGG